MAYAGMASERALFRCSDTERDNLQDAKGPQVLSIGSSAPSWQKKTDCQILH